MKINLLFLPLLFLVVSSCNSPTETKEVDTTKTEVKHEPKAHEKDKHWTYGGETGPEHWTEVEKGSDCNGKKQSPINIIESDAVTDESLTALDIHYSSDVKIHELTNNGHSIQYNFEKGDYITLNDKKYNLAQIHFHEPSEHTINGIRYPLEMHFVHTNTDNEIAVLSVMAVEGKSSAPFTFLEKCLPLDIGVSKVIDAKFDLNLNLPENKEYYTYSGSLTTPPCTEDVNWFIFKTPITVSLDQVKKLQEIMPLNNYRDEQALNDRVVKKFAN